jgi:hypothetical protein
MSLNRLILRLNNQETLGDVVLPGATFFPPETAETGWLRSFLGFRGADAKDNVLSMCLLIQAHSWLYASVGERVNTYEHLFAEKLRTPPLERWASGLKQSVSRYQTLLTQHNLHVALALATTPGEVVAIAGTCLALSTPVVETLDAG